MFGPWSSFLTSRVVPTLDAAGYYFIGGHSASPDIWIDSEGKRKNQYSWTVTPPGANLMEGVMGVYSRAKVCVLFIFFATYNSLFIIYLFSLYLALIHANSHLSLFFQ